MSSTESLAQSAHQPTTEQAERWAAIQQRTTRGMLLVNSGEPLLHLEGALWAVPASEGGYHRVNMGEETCTCPDFEFRAGPLGIVCKHVAAVAILNATRRGQRRPRATATLRELEERYAHELADDDERQEVRDRIMRLRRRLERGERER